jgi:hypothetical protein
MTTNQTADERETVVFLGVRRAIGQTQVRVEYPGRRMEHLPLRLDVCNHSPSGFEWGYSGSGPAQLALAMLLALGIEPDRAALWHQDVKRDLIVRLQTDVWQLTGAAVLSSLHNAEQRAERVFMANDPWRQ